MTNDFYLDEDGFQVEAGVLVKFNPEDFTGDLDDLFVPEGVTEIGPSAFQQCTDGEDDFCGVKGLTKVTLPTTCTVLRQGAFYSCQDLIEVKCLAKLELLEVGVFSDCNNLEFCVGVPKQQTSIPEHLYDRGGISHVRFPNHVKEIGFSAFYDDVNLEDVDFNNVEIIHQDAFYHCSLSYGIIIPPSMKIVEYQAFRDAMAPYIVIRSSSTTIDDGAFEGMFNVEYIQVPEDMEVPDNLWGIDDPENVEVRRK